jgi:iron(III) transport system substrate-binding protein
MSILLEKLVSKALLAATVASLSIVGSQSLAQDMSPELDAWLQANNLGTYSVGTEDWDDIVAKAREEGEVIVYSSSGRIAKLVDDFNAHYPEITLTLFDLGSVKTVEKTIREQDAEIFNVDIVTTGNSGQVIHEMLNKNRIFNYVPAHYIDRIPVENRDPLLIRVNEAIVVMYNGEAYPDGAPITNVWELTEPEFKGRIGIKNPMSSGSTLMGVATLVQYPDEMAAAYKRHTGSDIELGDGVPDAGYEFIRRLLQNDIVIFKSGSKLAGASGLRGQENPLLSIANMTYIARNDSDDYVNVIVSELDPVAKLVYPTFTSIAANAPHPNAAKVLTAYLLGSTDLTADTVLEKPYLEGDSFAKLQGLAPYFDPGTRSPRDDVPSPEGGEIWTDMKGWSVSADFMWSESPKLRDFWLIHSN